MDLVRSYTSRKRIWGSQGVNAFKPHSKAGSRVCYVWQCGRLFYQVTYYVRQRIFPCEFPKGRINMLTLLIVGTTCMISYTNTKMRAHTNSSTTPAKEMLFATSDEMKYVSYARDDPVSTQGTSTCMHLLGTQCLLQNLHLSI